MGINVYDAEGGQVKQQPKVPGTVPANNNELTTPKFQPLGPGGPGTGPEAQPQTPGQATPGAAPGQTQAPASAVPQVQPTPATPQQ